MPASSQSFVIENTPAALTGVIPKIEEFLDGYPLPKKDKFAVFLSVEEHLTNVIKYGYEPGTTDQIVFRLECTPEGVTFICEDHGKYFDSTKSPEPDTSSPLETRPIGGLGLHLIRKNMPDHSYERRGATNRIRLRRPLSMGPPGSPSDTLRP
ncbi:MAG: ATP-binding protein [Verrucomicrobiae bacterium]|nr:ATP-binding protein [Verrucomicrobiae bacterium]